MNQYQKFNLKHKEEKDKKLFIDGYVRRCGFKCTSCGKEVSPATVSFYGDNNLVSILCYSCQETADYTARKTNLIQNGNQALIY